MTDLDLGKLAYETHSAFLSWHRREPWLGLTEAEREAWRAAARAVRMVTSDLSTGILSPASSTAAG